MIIRNSHCDVQIDNASRIFKDQRNWVQVRLIWNLPFILKHTVWQSEKKLLRFSQQAGNGFIFYMSRKKAQKEATPSANQAKKSTAGKVQVSWQRRPLKSWIEVFSGTGKDSRSQHNEFGKKSTLIIS
jgi:hypothetical protein